MLQSKGNEITVTNPGLLRSLAHLESIYGLEPELPCELKVAFKTE